MWSWSRMPMIMLKVMGHDPLSYTKSKLFKIALSSNSSLARCRATRWKCIIIPCSGSTQGTNLWLGRLQLCVSGLSCSFRNIRYWVELGALDTKTVNWWNIQLRHHLRLRQLRERRRSSTDSLALHPLHRFQLHSCYLLALSHSGFWLWLDGGGSKDRIWETEGRASRPRVGI